MRLYFVEQDDLCNVDIDTKKQMNNFQEIIESNKKKYAKFLHTS
jgi:hypothetical protein